VCGGECPVNTVERTVAAADFARNRVHAGCKSTSEETTMVDDGDALQGDPDITSATDEPDPVNAPTTPEDEGNVGDGTGEGDAGPASGTTTSDGDEDDLTS
jgi:hypothetical protein